MQNFNVDSKYLGKGSLKKYCLYKTLFYQVHESSVRLQCNGLQHSCIRYTMMYMMACNAYNTRHKSHDQIHT